MLNPNFISKVSKFKRKLFKFGRKMTKLCPFNVLVPKWHLAYFVPIMAILAKVFDMDFKFVLPRIKINFDIQTNFEVNQIQISHSIPKNSPKSL